MPRNISAQSLVAIPVLTANETVALVHMLKSQLDPAHALPPSAQAPLDDLLHAVEGLERASVPASNEASGPSLADAHHAVQVAWGALEAWLGAYLTLDEGADPAVPKAKKLYGLLFGEGLGFVKDNVPEEWAESQARIAAVEGKDLAARFGELGGRAFWSRVLETHEAEGKLGHLLEGNAAHPQNKVSLLALMADVRAALKDYVLQVTASVRRGQPQTQALANHLLQPLMQWPHRKLASKAAPPAAKQDNPAKPQA
jgi:hypothetical protein